MVAEWAKQHRHEIEEARRRAERRQNHGKITPSDGSPRRTALLPAPRTARPRAMTPTVSPRENAMRLRPRPRCDAPAGTAVNCRRRLGEQAELRVVGGGSLEPVGQHTGARAPEELLAAVSHRDQAHHALVCIDDARLPLVEVYAQRLRESPHHVVGEAVRPRPRRRVRVTMRPYLQDKAPSFPARPEDGEQWQQVTRTRASRATPDVCYSHSMVAGGLEVMS